MESPIVGIRSKIGMKILGIDPFAEGAEIPLALEEELFMYKSRSELAYATRIRDQAATNQLKAKIVAWFAISLTLVNGVMLGFVCI